MVKNHKNRIEIYSSTNITDLKILITILILGCSLGIYMYFFAHAYNSFFLILSFFMIIGIYFSFKKVKKKKIPVLEAVITQESVKFYKENQVIEYKYSNLKNIAYDNIYSKSPFEIFANYYDHNKKLKTSIYYVTGCHKSDFANMVNSIKNSNEKFENIINVNNENELIHNKEENGNEKENLYERLKNGEILTVVFLGKDKLLKRIAKDSYSLPTSSKFYFIDENGNELLLYLTGIDIDYKKLKINHTYSIEYNKKYQKYKLLYIEQDFNKQIFEKAKNKIEYKDILLFEDIKIHKEIEYEQKMYKLANIIKYVLLLDLLLLLKNAKISIIIFFGSLTVNLIFLEYIKNKCKKHYNN